MSIGQNSRNLLTDVVQVIDPISGNLKQPPFVDLRQRVSTRAIDDRSITVDATMTWARLGLIQLSDARNWWVIADLSNVIDPFEELQVGAQLVSPSTHRLLFEILSPDQTTTSGQ